MFDLLKSLILALVLTAALFGQLAACAESPAVILLFALVGIGCTSFWLGTWAFGLVMGGSIRPEKIEGE